MVAHVMSSNMSENVILDDVLNWLLNDDMYHVCPNDENLVQRYATAAVAMSLDKQSILTSKHECHWEGIKCNHEQKVTIINFGK